MYRRDAWTLVKLAEFEVSPEALRAWAQLKLQRFFTPDVGSQTARQCCGACKAQVDETAEYLLEKCPRVELMLSPVMSRLAAKSFLVQPGTTRTGYILGYAPEWEAAVECVEVVHRIQKLVQNQARRASDAVLESDTSDDDGSE